VLHLAQNKSSLIITFDLVTFHSKSFELCCNESLALLFAKRLAGEIEHPAQLKLFHSRAATHLFPFSRSGAIATREKER
jgi:hypothetical protein